MPPASWRGIAAQRQEMQVQGLIDRILGATAWPCSMCLLLLVGLAGCASPPPADDPDAVAEFDEINDPFEPANRVIFEANDTVYRYVLRPTADGYRAVVPPLGRRMVANLLGNLKAPTVIANDLLQGNFPRAFDALGRLAVNTGFGVGGIMDVAEPMGLPRHDADFGQTLGVWGIGEGPYLVLPLFGPSNPRDGVGLAVDSFADPLDAYLQNHNLIWVSDLRYGASLLSLADSRVDSLDDVRRSSMDFYSAMRSLYRQRRTALIDGASFPSMGWSHLFSHL
jgi:phospholipid-binding lipoprotein MlaA